MTNSEMLFEKKTWMPYFALVVSIFLFALILFGVIRGDMFASIDGEINAFFASLATPFLTSLFTIITQVGSVAVMLVLAALVIIYLWRKKRTPEVLLVASSMTLGPGIGYLIKHVIERPRPELQLILEDGFSFPSGHALVATIFFSLLIYLFSREFTDTRSRGLFVCVNLLMIVLIGISRLYLGVHWFSDILGSFSLGFAVVLLMIVLNSLMTALFNYILNPFLTFLKKK
jgi:undecaprenyl-diphosphatase